MARLMIAATGKSCGKTIVAAGISRALVNQGYDVQPFKKGPDYIDPMWLSAASRRPCFNLDFNTMSAAELVAFFKRRQLTYGINLVEGNKGLFDGVDLHGSDCNAALAALLNLPVVLLVHCSGITRGIAPLLNGYAGFDDTIRFAGVILNAVGGSRHQSKLHNAVEEYTDFTVLGALARNPVLELTERHLGLITGAEHGAPEEALENIAREVAAQVDLRALLASIAHKPQSNRGETRSAPNSRPGKDKLTIGIARDRAFCFYYPDDLEKLEKMGGELVFIDFIKDAAIPAVDALFIGGGFPETQLDLLADNHAMRAAVKRLADAGTPIYAECGGLMYLCHSLSWRGSKRAMAGVIDADIVMQEKAVGRGYVSLYTTDSHPWRPYFNASDAVRLGAHEFHYSKLIANNSGAESAYRVMRGHGIDGCCDGIVVDNVFASYSHLRDTRQFPWVEYFYRHALATRANLCAGSSH